MDILTQAIIETNVELSIENAEGSGAEMAEVPVGVLRRLWEAYQAMGEALEPFAMAADSLNARDAEDKQVMLRTTCGDLRAARALRPR